MNSKITQLSNEIVQQRGKVVWNPETLTALFQVCIHMEFEAIPQRGANNGVVMTYLYLLFFVLVSDRNLVEN